MNEVDPVLVALADLAAVIVSAKDARLNGQGLRYKVAVELIAGMADEIRTAAWGE